jgi:3-hydroxyisobutyrate dehydrogenase
VHPIRKITFIGVGNMGNPMAGQLVKKGFEVTVFDARAETAQAFVKQHGGKAATTLADAGNGADAVIFMVPDDKVVREVLFEKGLAAALARGTTVIDMSSSAPEGTQAIGKDLAARGIGYVDAPVMGGVVFARDATLDIMAGGETAQVERCTPIFEAIGRKLYICGPLGSGHVLKCLTNYINACAMINTLEAMTIGAKFGLDSGVMADAIESMCNGRQHPIAKKVVPHCAYAQIRHGHGDAVHRQGRKNRGGHRAQHQRSGAACREDGGAVGGRMQAARRQARPDRNRALLGNRERRQTLNAIVAALPAR